MSNHAGHIWRKLIKGEQVDTQAYVESLFPPPEVGIYLNDRCNLNCTHCFVTRRMNKLPHLPLDRWFEVLKDISENGVKRIHFCGKEPLLDNKTFPLINYFSSLGGSSSIITNGTLIQAKLAEINASALDELVISVDGFVASHDSIRGVGSFDTVVGQLKELLLSFPISKIKIAICITKRNLHEISKLVLHFLNLGIESFFIQPFQIVRKEQLKSRRLLLSKRDFSDVITQLASLDRKVTLSIPIIAPFLPYLYSRNDIVRKSLEQYFVKGRPTFRSGELTMRLAFHGFCSAFYCSIRITPDGHVLGCPVMLASKNYSEYSVGNLHSLTIYEIFSRITSGNIKNKQNLLGKSRLCIKCKHWPLCRGGCRVAAHIFTGSWIGEDPMCSLTPDNST